MRDEIQVNLENKKSIVIQIDAVFNEQLGHCLVGRSFAVDGVEGGVIEVGSTSYREFRIGHYVVIIIVLLRIVGIWCVGIGIGCVRLNIECVGFGTECVGENGRGRDGEISSL